MAKAPRVVDDRTAATLRLLRTGWHPVQARALTILTERVASPKEIADELGVPVVGTVSYHVRELEKKELVEEVGTRQRRGATEHYFKAVQRPMVATEDWGELPLEKREDFSQYIIRLINADIGMAITSRTFDARTDRHLTRVPLCLDEQGFEDLHDEQLALLNRTLEIQAECDERRSKSKEPGIPASSVIATFEMPAVDRIVPEDRRPAGSNIDRADEQAGK